MSISNVFERTNFYVINASGIVSEFGFESPISQEGCFVVSSPIHNFKCALFSLHGTQLTDFIYDDLNNFSEGVGRYSKNGKYGLINTDAVELTEPIFDQVGFVHDGKVVVEYKGKYCLYNLQDGLVKEYTVDQIRLYDSLQYGVMVVLKGDPNSLGNPNNRYYLMNIEGEYVSRACKHTIVLAKPDVFYELEDGVHYIFDSTGNETALPVKCSDIKVYGNGLFMAYRGDKYALVTIDGDMLTDFVWSDVRMNDEIENDWICVCY